MDATDKYMLHILSLDKDAHLRFSTYTSQWYIRANVSTVTKGGLVTGHTCHEDSPDRAVYKFWKELTEVQDLDVLIQVGNYQGATYYRWNGVCFALEQITR
jgi:hypothetical protein